jgi:nucleoside-diphosphate-sugar epimerase
VAALLVVGASGAVGRFLLPRLLERGDTIHALSRSPRTTRAPGLHWIVGDLFAGMPPLPALDAIVGLGPLDAFAARLAASGFDGVPRVVALGSMSATTKRGSRDPHERALAQRLAYAERVLADAAGRRGCAWTVLRPTLIYGAGIDRSLAPIAHFAARWRLAPSLPAARGLRQPVHAADLADAVLAALQTPDAHARRYDLGGGERLPFAAMLARIRASLARRALPLPVPLAVLRAATVLPCLARLREPVRRLTEDLVADDAQARRDLDWRPRGFRPDADCWRPKPLP